MKVEVEMGEVLRMYQVVDLDVDFAYVNYNRLEVLV